MPRLPTRPLAAAAAVATVLVAGWLWFRDSSFVRVRDVYVVGVSSSDGSRIRTELRAAAREMTTLNVREEDLRVAVRRFPSVDRLHARADFPHALTIEVVEREPIAAVELTSGTRIPVGAGGLLMRGVRPAGELPTLRARRIGPAGRLSDRRALSAVSVLAAAPAPLRKRIERAWWSPRGLVLDLRNGPDVVFGPASQPRRKWAAAVRVLAEPSALGATYVDVRIPERVAAGGLQPVTPENPQPQPENPAILNP